VRAVPKKPLQCCICNQVKLVRRCLLSHLTTCGQKICVAERVREQVHARGPEWRAKQSAIAKARKFGGTNFIENIQPLCGDCNMKKYTRTIDYTARVYTTLIAA
jgi:5-methylcytosine-specific restriction endonuclease McrA